MTAEPLLERDRELREADALLADARRERGRLSTPASRTTGV
jgi:hypothetical protein